MGKKITPIFGNSNEDPSNAGILQALRMNIEALLKWARITEQKIAFAEQALLSYETALIRINASLEAVCRILIEKELIEKDQLHKYAEEYVSAHNAFIEEQKKQAEAEIEAQKPSKIWTPNKKIIPVG